MDIETSVLLPCTNDPGSSMRYILPATLLPPNSMHNLPLRQPWSSQEGCTAGTVSACKAMDAPKPPWLAACQTSVFMLAFISRLGPASTALLIDYPVAAVHFSELLLA